jgi:hypothetical protein
LLVETEEERRLKRIECPYPDVDGKKCGVVAFGSTETVAYKRLEDHVSKIHPEKLREFNEIIEKTKAVSENGILDAKSSTPRL